jgi:hypothetical protein
MKFLLEASIAFLSLGILEAVVKPVAKRFVQGRILRHAPSVFEAIDPIMPRLIDQFSGDEIEEIVRKQFEMITGEDWSKVNLKPFWDLYDVRRAADRLN